MNKKLNFLAIIPVFGTVILLVYLFFLALKKDISRKKFMITFWICGIVSGICWIGIFLIFSLLANKLPDLFVGTNWIPVAIVIAGYMMNFFTFVFLNKKWKNLFDDND